MSHRHLAMEERPFLLTSCNNQTYSLKELWNALSHEEFMDKTEEMFCELLKKMKGNDKLSGY